MTTRTRRGLLLVSQAFALLSLCPSALGSPAAPPPALKKVIVVVLENTNFKDALSEPFFGRLAREGALLSNLSAETHPSQPNYIALVAGSVHGVRDDANVTLDVRHIGDLLEEKGKSWRVYAEGYPGSCFQGAHKGAYARKHVPFLSFRNVTSNPTRCAEHVTPAGTFLADARSGRLPDFTFYVPDLNNDGHDTGYEFAGRWMAKTFGPLLDLPAFKREVLLVTTFDESQSAAPNQIYTTLYGAGVTPGAKSNTPYTHFSLLRTFEVGFGLGSLGLGDAQASPITGVWSKAAAL